MIIPYFKQEKSSTCSLAILRMVLHAYGIKVREKDLYEKVVIYYGKSFKNIWNPTIARIACEYGIKTTMYALWPLFKKETFPQAIKDYEKNPQEININKYENKNDQDNLPEPLPLAYQEMFAAIKKGCQVYYGSLTTDKIKQFLAKGHLIQTSVKLHLLYPDKKSAYHSILLYDLKDDQVVFHDPSYGQSQTITFERLTKTIMNVGAGIVYKGKS